MNLHKNILYSILLFNLFNLHTTIKTSEPEMPTLYFTKLEINPTNPNETIKHPKHLSYLEGIFPTGTRGFKQLQALFINLDAGKANGFKLEGGFPVKLKADILETDISKKKHIAIYAPITLPSQRKNLLYHIAYPPLPSV